MLDREDYFPWTSIMNVIQQSMCVSPSYGSSNLYFSTSSIMKSSFLNAIKLHRILSFHVYLKIAAIAKPTRLM